MEGEAASGLTEATLAIGQSSQPQDDKITSLSKTWQENLSLSTVLIQF